jgi:hypothetical protein
MITLLWADIEQVLADRVMTESGLQDVLSRSRIDVSASNVARLLLERHRIT